jgi:hypothetical protein
MKRVLLAWVFGLGVLPLAFAASKEAEWIGLITQAGAVVKLKGDLRTEPQRVTEMLHDRYVGQPAGAILRELEAVHISKDYGWRTRQRGPVLECSVYRVTPESEISVTFSFRCDAGGRVTDVAWQCHERALAAAK